MLLKGLEVTNKVIILNIVMIKVSHECPLSMLEDSFEFNDYDYLLPTFWYDHEEYRNHFIKAREKGRFIIMDNGLFEGGVMEKEMLLDIYNQVQPDVFITPDGWNDPDFTLQQYLEWKAILPPEKLMVVIQGENMFDVEELYDTLVKDGIKYIGFNHLGKFYDDYSCHSQESVRKSLGRIEFIHYLKETGKLDENIHYHLLGCNSILEFPYYNDVPEIKTLDTSNPITCAFEGIDFNKNIPPHKPKTKVEDVFHSVDRGKIWLSHENMKHLKQLIK